MLTAAQRRLAELTPWARRQHFLTFGSAQIGGSWKGRGREPEEKAGISPQFPPALNCGC